MRRKTFLKNTAAVIGAGLLPGATLASDENKKQAIRFAFMTDIHMKHGLGAESGIASALHHIQSQKPKIDFIVNGGDSIWDSLAVDKEGTRTQWDLYQTILKKENGMQVYHCIGNHDVWGWFIKGEKPDADKLYGKQWVVDELQLPGRYYGFDKGNWRFLVLDSTQLNPAGGYIAYIDEAQLAWLKQELETHRDKHICFLSHIPILSICAGLFFNKTEANGDLKIQRNLMHTDFLTLNKLFMQYPNIRACLSGHIHMQDELEYHGIKYYCNGAISGNWWKGAFNGFSPAYAVFEFKSDGTTSRKMVEYHA